MMTSRADNLDYILRQLMAECEQQYDIPESIAGKQRMMRALMNVWNSERIQAYLEGRGVTNEDKANIRQPIPASEDFLKAQDKELQLQAEEKGTVEVKGKGIQLWQGDITRLKADAIVNAANSQMLGCWVPLHNCIDNCIHSAAGIQLRQECFRQMEAQGHEEPTGRAKITLGYNLPAKHVIHTVGPIIPKDSQPTEEQELLLASCYRSCLDIADANNLKSIAFCCISTGVFNFPNHRAAEIAIATVKEWIAAHHATSINQVVFNVFLDKDYNIYHKLLSEN